MEALRPLPPRDADADAGADAAAVSCENAGRIHGRRRSSDNRRRWRRRAMGGEARAQSEGWTWWRWARTWKGAAVGAAAAAAAAPAAAAAAGAASAACFFKSFASRCRATERVPERCLSRGECECLSHAKELLSSSCSRGIRGLSCARTKGGWRCIARSALGKRMAGVGAAERRTYCQLEILGVPPQVRYCHW